MIDLMQLALKSDEFRNEVLDDPCGTAKKYGQPLKTILAMKLDCLRIQLAVEVAADDGNVNQEGAKDALVRWNR